MPRVPLADNWFTANATNEAGVIMESFEDLWDAKVSQWVADIVAFIVATDAQVCLHCPPTCDEPNCGHEFPIGGAEPGSEGARFGHQVVAASLMLMVEYMKERGLAAK